MSRVRVALLNAADWVVPDLDVAAARLTALLPELRTTGLARIPQHDFDSVFLRGTAEHAQAPTRFQLVALPETPAGPVAGCAWAPFQPMQDLQGRARVQRVHGTVLAVYDFDGVVTGLRVRGVPVHVEHECAHLPYRRAWLGWTGRERVDGIDGGLFVEFIPIEVFPKAVRESVGQPLSGPIPSLRVARRINLVRSLDAAVSQLSELVGLGEPGPFDDDLLGVRGARWSFLHPGGAELVVAEAHGAGPAADHLAEAGPGTWLTTIDCTDPAALAESCVACGATQAALGDGRIHLTDPDTGIRLELRTAAG